MPLTYQDFEHKLKEFADYSTPLEKKMREDFEFAALDQWATEDRQKLERQNKPALVFDNTRTVIDAVSGSEVSNRYEVKFYPRNLPGEDVDVEASETMQEIHRWVRQQSDVEQQESAAFRDMLICGYGVTHTYMDYADNPDGRIVTVRKSPFEVGWDVTATAPNLTDRDCEFVGTWVDEEYFNQRFPGADGYRSNSQTEARGGFLSRLVSNDTVRGRNTYSGGNKLSFYDPKSKKVRLWEYNYRKKVRKLRVLIPNPMGGMDELWLEPEGNDAEMRQLIEVTGAINSHLETLGLPAMGEVDWNEQDRYEYRTALIAGNEILQDEENPVREFPLQFMTGFEDMSEPDRKYHFGLMETMKDPQRYVNKFYSQAVHTWATSPKGVLLYESDLFEDPEQAGDEWAKADGTIPVRPGSLSTTARPKFHMESVNRSFAGAESLFQFAEAAIPKAAGVNIPYAAGLAGDLRRTAASAIQSVQQQNFVTLSSLFDSMRLYRKRQARLVLGMVREYMPEDQVIRVIGPNGPNVVQFTKDDLVHEYDIIADESAVSPNRQQAVFDNLVNTGLLNQMLEMGIVPPSLWKYLPLPNDVGMDIATMMTQQQQMVDPGAPPPPPA